MSKEIIPVSRVAPAIRILRGEKIRLDSDLALLHGVETRVLNQAVKRNAVTPLRKRSIRKAISDSSQIVMSSRKHRGKRYRHYAFTEQGIAMLASVLKSDRFGERTRLACWRWRPRHRELFLPVAIVFYLVSRRRFSARRRKGHARRVCSRE